MDTSSSANFALEDFANGLSEAEIQEAIKHLSDADLARLEALIAAENGTKTIGYSPPKDLTAGLEFSVPQRQFLDSEAQITIYGGAAGAGKTHAILSLPLLYAADPLFASVCFRRTGTQIKKTGSLWDAAADMYAPFKTTTNETLMTHAFPGGGQLQFAGLEHEKSKFDWQGTELPLIMFDELTHFEESQFFYLLSRNRGKFQGRKRVCATTNPDADSWVARLIEWWIDPVTGEIIPERSGVIRWFVTLNGTRFWGDSKAELIAKYGNPNLAEDDPNQVMPYSITFIRATIFDNVWLLRNNPEYLASLKALPPVEQARLLGGNWKIRASAGLFFKREWVEIVDIAPANCEEVRYWDLAATEKTNSNDPDWTVGAKLLRDRKTGIYYVADVRRLREGPNEVEQAIRTTASHDGLMCRIGLPQDPGQAGKTQAAYFVRQLAGYNVSTKSERGDKVTRFGPFSAQCKAGNVKFVRGAWNEDVFNVLEGFPDASHDDDADALSGAFAMYLSSNLGHLEYMTRKADAIAAENEKKTQANVYEFPNTRVGFG